MNAFRYDYAVIGGDLRQIYLMAELEKENQNVCHYALCQSPKQFPAPVRSAAHATLEAACSSSACILCPIPLSRDSISLNQSGIKKNIPLKQLLIILKPGQRLFAGCIPKDFCQAALEKDILVFDFMKDMSLSCFNSIATAESVICEAIKASPKNLHQSRCAVLGYGKCGRTITDLLKRMYCSVTVGASYTEELALAALTADEAEKLPTLLRHIETFDFIFNTIPAVILTREVLLNADPQTVILDIASSPGGVDFAAAEELSVHAMSCPGLPGRYAPLSSAQAIVKSIKNFERSSPCL